MVKIGAVLNVAPPATPSTTTKPSTTTTTATTTSTATTATTSSIATSGVVQLSQKSTGVQSTTSSTTERRPKVVAVDDDKLFPDTDDDVIDDVSDDDNGKAKTGAKPFSSYDYADKKLGKGNSIIKIEVKIERSRVAKVFLW